MAAQVAPDQTYAAGMEDNSSLALFTTANAASFNSTNRLDAAGFDGATGPLAPMFREGAAMPGVNATEVNVEQWSIVRKMSSGVPQDTNDNAQDFVRVSPTSMIAGSEPAILGAAGPENTTSPSQRNASVKASLVDTQADSTAPPNRGRDIAPVTNGAQGTLVIRRKFTNKTGLPVSRLRFRIIDITTLNTPNPGGQQADLRALDSINVNVTTTSGASVLIRGTTLEQPPPQNWGGGLNSTMVVALPNGSLANGASVNVQFVLGVQAGGRFRFLVNVEAANGSTTFSTQKGGTKSLSR
jgi:hypothetical protein